MYNSIDAGSLGRWISVRLLLPGKYMKSSSQRFRAGSALSQRRDIFSEV